MMIVMRNALLRRALAWTAAGAVLAAVFMSYRQPQLMFELATLVWNCF